MPDPNIFELDPELRRKAEQCADQIPLIKELEERGYTDQALTLTEMTLDASVEIRRRALMPWSALTHGMAAGLSTPGYPGVVNRAWNAAIGASMGWFLGHASQHEAMGDLDYLVDALGEHSDTLRTLLKNTPQGE